MTFLGKKHNSKSKERICIGVKKLYDDDKKIGGFKKGIVAWNKGKKSSKRTRKKLSKSHIGNKSALGHRLTKEVKKRISDSKKGKNIKEKHWNWKGGIATSKRKLFLNLRRRSRKLNAEGEHTQGEWETLKKQYGYKCPCCKREEPEIILTEDHIIPLSRGGSDYIENIQPLCKSCNCKKHTKIINYKRF